MKKLIVIAAAACLWSQCQAQEPLMVTNWLWFASSTLGGTTNRTAKCYSSPDGITNWVAMSPSGWDYKDPDWMTNNSDGPITTEQAVQWRNNKWESVYNYDPYNTNGNAQALAFASSSIDFLSWHREALIWPFGKTNAGACFAATWFTDNDGSNYLVIAWSEGVFNAFKNLYTMRRLDESFTNWSAPAMVASNDIALWDGGIVRVGNRYDLYTIDNGSHSIIRMTNSSLTTLFSNDASVEFSTGGDYTYTGEAPWIVRLTATNWRLYFRPDYEVYGETSDSGDHWGDVSIPNRVNPDINTRWHGPGIVMQRKLPALTIQGRLLVGVQ